MCPAVCGCSRSPMPAGPVHSHDVPTHPVAPQLHPSLPHTISRRETDVVSLAPLFAKDHTRDSCNSHQISGQIHADTGRVLYKTTCIWQVCDRRTMGKVIKHGFWGAFKWMVFQQCLRGYRAQNTVMYRRCLCKSQLLSLGHCALFTKLLELSSTGAAHACITPSHFSFLFVLWAVKHILTSLKAATNNILQNFFHFWAVLLYILSHNRKMLLPNLCTECCLQIPCRNRCSWREGKKKVCHNNQNPIR